MSFSSLHSTTLADFCTPTVNSGHNCLWTIDNFSFHSEEWTQELPSSTFRTLNNDMWRLLLFPRGNNDNLEKYVSLFLELVESENKESEIKIKFDVCILNEVKQKVLNKQSKTFSFLKAGEFKGFPEFIEREVLLKDETFLPNDNLTIFVKLSMISDTIDVYGESCVKNIKVPKHELTLGHLLDSGKFADIKIVVKNFEIPVHKAILAGRSDVFAAMFEHEMKESKEHRLIIDDLDPEVVKDLLHFIYTDTVPSNLDTMADSLLIAADKYALPKLKLMCEEALRVQLSVETACKTLVLADRHKAEQLKVKTVDFISTHLEDIIKTQDFLDLTTRYAHFNKELFLATTQKGPNSLIEPFIKLVNDTSSPLSWCRTKSKVMKYNFVWTIKEFSCRTGEIREGLSSPIIFIPDHGQWRLKLLSDGNSDIEKQFISLVMNLEDFDNVTEDAIKFKFSILNAEREKNYVTDSEIFRIFAEKDEICLTNFIKRDELLNNASLLPGDNLTIQCEAYMSYDDHNISGELHDVKIKFPDSILMLGYLLDNAKYADVTIVMNDIEIPAHKPILAGRSDVFAAIFEQEMHKPQQSRFSVADFDSQVFRELLRFIYIDTAPNVHKMAPELLAAADKYALPKLKLICVQELSAQLDVETASKILKLADLHKVNQLKVETMDFINANLVDVVKTQGFEDLAKANSHLNMELFGVIVKKRKLSN